MERERDDRTAEGGCCAGGTGRDGAQRDPGASSCCCGSPARRPWVRTVIALIVILAAVAVGAYSLVKRPAAAPGDEAALCCPANSSAGVACQPGDSTQQACDAACCPGAAGDTTGVSR